MATLQANVDAIVEADGIASINHPNFRWAVDHRAISRVEGASLLEVFNGHPAANLFGAADKPSYEEIWDGVLSAGRVIFGVATDDSHNYHDFAPWLSNPGRGWVMVQSDELTQEAIVDGLASGRFYASTGVTLTRLECTAEGIVLEIDRSTTSYIRPVSPARTAWCWPRAPVPLLSTGRTGMKIMFAPQ